MRLARVRPELFDVGLTGVDREIWKFFSKEQSAQIERSIDVVPRVDMAETLPKYKFVLSVAAVLSSWRLTEMFPSGAVIFLQQNSDMDLLHAQMTPWVHYVPVRNDLSDVIERIEYMIAHDDEAQRMAAASFAFFQANVTRSRTMCYLWRTLRSIAANSDLVKVSPEEMLRSQRRLGWMEVRKSKSVEYLKEHLATAEL